MIHKRSGREETHISSVEIEVAMHLETLLRFSASSVLYRMTGKRHSETLTQIQITAFSF